MGERGQGARHGERAGTRWKRSAPTRCTELSSASAVLPLLSQHFGGSAITQDGRARGEVWHPASSARPRSPLPGSPQPLEVITAGPSCGGALTRNAPPAPGPSGPGSSRGRSGTARSSLRGRPAPPALPGPPGSGVAAQVEPKPAESPRGPAGAAPAQGRSGIASVAAASPR